MESQQKSTSKRSAYHHGNLRDHLIAATRSLIESNGSEHFKVADACRHAGVSTAAPYRHFVDRQALLNAVAIAGFHDLRDKARTAGSQYSSGSVDAVSAIGQAYVAFAACEPNLFRLMFGQNTSDTDSQAGNCDGLQHTHIDRKSVDCANTRMTDCEKAGRECYEVLLEQLVVTLNRESIDEAVVKAAFPLWTFVHGLSFLVIDGNLSVNQMPINIKQQIEWATECLMPSTPNERD